MALWRCLNCGSKFAVGLRCCPQCTSTRCVEDSEELDMPKTTASGATNADDPNAAEGGAGWDGNDSSTSSPSDETNSEPSSPEDQSPAPTTESHSSTGPTDGSTAPSTDGDPTTEDGVEVTGELVEQAPYEEWTNEALRKEIDRRNEVRAELGADRLPVSGTKAELVERLEDDDTDPNRPEAPAIEPGD